MFSLFAKDRSPSFPVRDKIWKTAGAAQKGLLMMAMMRLQQQQPALLFTFFEEEKQKLSNFMNENQIAFKEINLSSSADDLAASQIYLIGEDAIQSTLVSHLLSKNLERFGNTVYFQCHYPVITDEDKVLAKLSGLGFSTFYFCLSFEDPMMNIFSLKNILPLLEKLGLDENEAIEHDMVSKSIKNARKKISEKVRGEKKATSAAEWFSLNIKP